MYCKECGNEILSVNSDVCLGCGTKKGNGSKFCQECGEKLKSENAEICLSCGVRVKKSNDLMNSLGNGKSKIVAALLAFFLGTLGIHRFYLGYTNVGIIQIVLTLAGAITCGITSVISLVWSIVDLVFILTGKLNHASGEELE